MSSYTSTPITVSSTARSIVDVDNPTSGEVASQTNNELYKRLATLKVTDESKTYFNFVENNLGVRFNVFLEEPVYERNFTDENGDRGSYPGDQTARYHMVGMLLSGSKKHGFTTPLRNDQIKSVHKELTDEKISAMRSVFNTNSTQRPFVFPVQISGYAPNTSELEKLKTLQRELYSYVNSKTPLEFKKTETFEGAPFNRKYHVTTEKSTISSGSASRPSNPNSGDLWFDSSSGRLFAYVKINNSIQWLEV